jgi:hypothetical protein
VKRADLQRAADPTGYAEGLAATVPPPDDEHRHHEIVRTDTYQGRRIVVRTTYEIEVDGKAVTTPMHIDNDGNVVCHAIPVYQSVSMVEVVHRLIDVFPEDFPKPKRPRRPRTPRSGGGAAHHRGGSGGGGGG